MSASESFPVTPAESVIVQLPWTPIKSTKANLLDEMLRMYWNGVLRELAHIILCLSEWQRGRLSTVSLKEEEDNIVCGYETFLEQVNESSRAFAISYGNVHPAERHAKSKSRPAYSYLALERLKDLQAERKSLNLKNAVSESIEALVAKQTTNIVQQRARMLLQGADIDKLMQYRNPLKRHNFWKKPRTPQLALQAFDRYSMPIFMPMACSHCGDVIRGIMFQCVEPKCREFRKSGLGDYICENCYYTSAHPRKHLTKHYKHSILQETITPEISRKICRCSSVPRIDKNGVTSTLFPVDPKALHRGSPSKGTIKCGLLTLNERIAEAKYESQMSLVKTRKELEKIRREAAGEKEPDVRIPNLHSPFHLIRDGGALYDEYHDEDIPAHIKRYTDRYPFGNVHVSLMLGPLVIENGAKNSNDGVLITIRDPPQFQSVRDSDREIEHSLSISPERKLYHQLRGPRVPRRLKACMKQVVGGAFSGYLNKTLEQEIVDALVEESSAYRTDPRKSSEYNEGKLTAAADRIMAKVRKLLESRVRFYLGTITNKLFDETVDLRWDKKSNNCQRFCESIIDYEAFSSLVCTRDQGAEIGVPNEISPLYLMSFVCRPGGYTPENVSTRFDVPNGLTEEYILKFRFGHHDEADIFDTLQEFWHDWGAFGGNLYENQKLFPWDCTEAYSRHPGYCNDCSLSKHIWSFPFDSWSIIQLHLQKDRHLYPPSREIAGERLLSDEEWMRNRLTVLLAQNKLIQGAMGMARTHEFRLSTAWLHQQREARIDRLKLGGIHRAQPYSHQYERGAYQEYFVADWAHLQQPEQVEAYERMRNERVAMPDMPHPRNKTQKVSRSSGGGDGAGPDCWLVGWYGVDAGTGDACPAYAADGWDGCFLPDEYCVNVPDGASGAGNCASSGGCIGGGLSCGGGGGGCGGGGCGGG